MRHCFFTLFAGICMTIGVHAQKSLLVCTHIESGDIEGVVEDSVAIYKAIPYAAPPVGNLRWKAPQPVKPWNSVKKMTTYGPWPPQLSRRSNYSAVQACQLLKPQTRLESHDTVFGCVSWRFQ